MTKCATATPKASRTSSDAGLASWWSLEIGSV
jgi:hypothetical protein